MTTTFRFFMYVRKSRDEEDRQVKSVEAQLAELKAFAARLGIVIVEVFIERLSAKTPGARPLFKEMIDRIENGEADGILAWHADRLARNTFDGSMVIDLFDTGKLKRLQLFGTFVENTPQGKMMLAIEFGFSKYYIDILSENVKRGHRAKIALGDFPGRARIGYLNNRRTKVIKIDKVRAPVVRQAFEMYGDERASYDTLREFLFSRGIRTRQTKRWPGGRPISRASIATILRNPLYYGHFRWGGVLYEGNHEPIISKQLFDRAQSVLAKRLRHSLRKVKRPKAYVGVMRCGECGCSITAEIQKGHVYYRCSKKNRARVCSQPYLRQESFEAQLPRLLSPFQRSNIWATEMLDKLESDEANLIQTADREIAAIRKQIGKIDVKMRSLEELLIDELIDREVARPKREKMLSEKRVLEDEIASLAKSSVGWVEPMRKWILTAQRLGETANMGDKKAKSNIAKEIFGSNLLLTGKKARGVAINPWAILAPKPGGYTTAQEYNLARKHFRGHEDE